MSYWCMSHHADPRAVPLADRHYSRKTIGAPQFTPPGRKLVLLTPDADALWVTSWPFAQYVRRAYPGAWCCSLFRNESPHLSSALIREAVAATRWYWPSVPKDGMITLVNVQKVRHKRDPGRCYLKAGFRTVGFTKGGLLILQLLPHEMPEAAPPEKAQLRLFMTA